MSRRGARPIEDILRNLLAVMNALSREGSIVDAKGVSYLLGLTREEAADVITDVMEAATGADASTGVVLPLEGDAERGIHLMRARAGAKPIRALRMTAAEARAMVETLDGLGVDDKALGGIRPKIERALFPMAMAKEMSNDSMDVDKDDEGDKQETSSLPKLLIACLDALYCNQGLRFDYAGERGMTKRRLAEPLSLQYLFGQWVLDALDLGQGSDDGLDIRFEEGVSRETGRSDEVKARSYGIETSGLLPNRNVSNPLDRRRFFLVDRLLNVEPIDLPSTHVELRNLPWDEGGQWVRLYFTDRSRYDHNPEWTWSREVARSALSRDEKRRIGPKGCAVDVRYFPGSPYLARLVVSCAGTCTTDDPTLLEDIRTYLKTLPVI